MPIKRLDKKVIITGGGSGGHISAATAIIDHLREKYENTLENILYIGSSLPMEGERDNQSLEQKLLQGGEIPFVAIRAGKLQRYLSIESIKMLWGVVGGLKDAWRELTKFKPDIIISTGGYVTVPVCFVGWLKKIPIYIHEQTAAVGLTNKITSKFARRIYISFTQSDKYFPAGKTLHVGNAIRQKIFDDSGSGEVVEAVKAMLEEQERLPIVLIAGGGQGSHILNLVTRQMLRYCIHDFQIVLQTGDNKIHRDFDIMWKEKLKLPKEIQHRFFPVKFIDSNQIGYVFKHINMYAGRGGANFVYEMGLLRKPSILVPIPWVTHNEQHKNAQVLVEAGLGKILPEGELTAEMLCQEIKKIVKRVVSNQIKLDIQKLERLFPTGAVEKIVNDLLENNTTAETSTPAQGLLK